MKKIKSKNKFYQYSTFILILSILVVFLSIYLNYSFILDKQIFSCSLKVNETAGFDLSNSTLSFGAITPVATSSREIEVANAHPFSISVSLSSKGNISRFLIFEKKIIVPAMENRTITIGTRLPEKKDYGDYEGNLILVVKREI